MNREDFEIFENNLIYFDNAATTMKPKSVVKAICDYYTKYTANAHRGDYDNSLKVDEEYEGYLLVDLQIASIWLLVAS